MPKARISTWVVLLILAPSFYVTANLAFTYLEAAFVKPTAQWQFAFFLVPIPVVLGLVALAVAYMSRSSRPVLGACVLASFLPCVLFALVKLHVY
jgi:hypothetical protein